ncbi:MAG: KfrA protein [Aestuariibacter sp.]|nr:KfrA protein [Aestuariibacter sp.]MCP5017425.1 KfrA protein [Ketobacter sp.]
MTVKPEIKSKIINTANTLVAEGVESPTNDQVRERMGGGSLSHISPVMREWREGRKSEVAAALEIPSDLKKAIETSLSQVWSAANKLASATVEKVQQEAQVAIDAASSERDEALSEVSRLEERILELQKVVEDKEKAAQVVKNDLEKERGQASKLASESAALTAKVEDRDAQVKELKGELTEARDNNRSLQAELIALAKQAQKGQADDKKQ